MHPNNELFHSAAPAPCPSPAPEPSPHPSPLPIFFYFDWIWNQIIKHIIDYIYVYSSLFSWIWIKNRSNSNKQYHLKQQHNNWTRLNSAVVSPTVELLSTIALSVENWLSPNWTQKMWKLFALKKRNYLNVNICCCRKTMYTGLYTTNNDRD